MTTRRRPRAWSDTLVNRIIASGSGTAPIDLLLQLAASDTKTAVRLIGDFVAFPDDRNASVDGVAEIDMGVGVAASEAFIATVVPDPNNQADYPTLGWLYATTKFVIFNNSSGTTEKLFIPEWHFDIRANRKVDKGVLYLAINNTNADAAGYDVRVVGRVRALCLT